jgi:hypothetical protein
MKIVLFIASFLLALQTQAQEIPMADEMRANGKIFVVVAVLGVILLGLIIYLISLDRKIKKLEEERKQ